MRGDVTGEQGIAVRCRFRGNFSAEIAGGASAVLDHDLLPEELGQPGGHDTVRNVDAAAWREGHDDANRPAGVRLRVCFHPRDQSREYHYDCRCCSPALYHDSSFDYRTIPKQ